MSQVISGRGKIDFYKEKDKEKMEKKYPDVQFKKMNPLTFTTTYKGNEIFDLKIKVGSTEIPCSFKKFAWPWKYGSKLALEPYFEDLKKKADIRITGGIQGKLFRFFRYDYEKMLKDNPQRQESIKLKAKINKLTTKQKKAIDDHLRKTYSRKKWVESLSDKADPELLKEYNKILKNPDKELEKIKKKDKKGGGICWPCLLTIPSKRKKGGGKKTFKSEKRKEHKNYNKSVKKCRKMKAKTEKERKKKGKCYLPIDKKRLKMFQYFKKEYPEEWAEFLAPGGEGNDTQKTGLEGSWLYDWEPWPNKRSSPRKKRGGSPIED